MSKALSRDAIPKIRATLRSERLTKLDASAATRIPESKRSNSDTRLLPRRKPHGYSQFLNERVNYSLVECDQGDAATTHNVLEEGPMACRSANRDQVGTQLSEFPSESARYQRSAKRSGATTLAGSRIGPNGRPRQSTDGLAAIRGLRWRQ